MFQFNVSAVEFVKVVKEHSDRPIRVVRAGTARAVLEGTAVVMRPTVVIRYALSVPTPHGGDVIHDEYVHEELWFADNEGVVDESKSLLSRFQKTPAIRKRLSIVDR